MYQPFKIRVNCEPNQCLCPNDDDARSINVNNKSYGGCGRKEKKRERKGAPPPTSSLTSQPRFGRGGLCPVHVRRRRRDPISHLASGIPPPRSICFQPRESDGQGKVFGEAVARAGAGAAAERRRPRALLQARQVSRPGGLLGQGTPPPRPGSRSLDSALRSCR
jgi:hypothetical protein